MFSNKVINLLLLMSVLEISVLTLSFQSSAASVCRVRERTKKQWDMVVLRRITDMEYNLKINEKYKSAHKTGKKGVCYFSRCEVGKGRGQENR